jgi:thiol-disulfide isomerase/thioredoxin
MIFAGPSPKRPPHIVFLPMPQTRPALLAWIAAIAIVAIAAGVYVRLERAVHGGPPSGALAKLVPDAQAKPIADVVFADGSGQLHKLSDFRGRYMLLNLWATWCAPCVHELPALSHLQGALGARQLSVVPVNVGRSTAADTAAFLKTHKADLPVYLDSNSAFLHAFGAYGLPLTVLVDPKGREIARATGGVRWDAPESVAYFRSLSDAQAKS